MKKTTALTIILVIMSITSLLCLLDKNISMGIMVLILLAQFLLLFIPVFFWLSYKERMELEKKREEQERLKIQQKKEEERKKKLDSMTETDLLIWDGAYDLIIEGNSFEEYRHEFAPFNHEGNVFPAIPEEFKNKLKEKTPGKIKVRKFSIKRDGMAPAHYFDSIERDTIVISLSADNIMKHFVSNFGHRGETNWYLWNKEPNKAPDIKNIEIVVIQRTTAKFYLRCFPYSKLTSMGLNYIEKKEGQKFFVPVP